MGLQHLRAIATTRQATLVGIADPVLSRDQLGALLPTDAVIVPTAAELLERTRPDVVHIVTPPDTHVELAALAIQAGSHVYVEKPFTRTRAEAERIIAMAADHGAKVCAGHQVLFEPPALAVRAALGNIGRVVHIESYFSFKMVRRTITQVQQVQDILPHAVYPVVDQLRAATGLQELPIEMSGLLVDAGGEVHALLHLGKVTAHVLVTLSGRPIEQFQQLVGTNGSLRADYIGGSLTRLIGPGTGPAVLLTPYRRAFRTFTGTTRGIARLVLNGGASYPGLPELIGRFYSSIRENTAPPLTPRSILDTVDICERIGDALEAAERTEETAARARLLAAEATLPRVQPGRAVVLVTGGTGMLGQRIAGEVRQAGIPVRVVARRIPPYSRRVAGVEYAVSDLSRPVDTAVLRGVGLIVHAAAETAGGTTDHQRNSVDATRNLLEAAAQEGVSKVVHVSSLAILKPSREAGGPLDEGAPVDGGNTERGPYVWGKAESELVAQRLGAELGLQVKVIRPGPLVDYAHFQPPGRLGREIGPLFVAVGPKRAALSVCDVSTAARVIRFYVEEFDSAPAVLNLVEAPSPSRRDLLKRFLAVRPDLKAIWLPAVLLRMLSRPLKLVQRLAFGATHPVDVAAAFSSERYRTDLAALAIERAGKSGSAYARAALEVRQVS